MEAATLDILFSAFRTRYGFDVPPRLAELARTREDYRRSLALKVGLPVPPEPAPKPAPNALPCIHRSPEPIGKEPCLPCAAGKSVLVDVYGCVSPGVKSGRCTVAKGKGAANARPCELCNLRQEPPIDAVWFFRHSSHDDEELRYSLRSVARHAPWIRRCFILGDRPKWLAESDRVRHLSWDTLAPPLGFKAPLRNAFLMFRAAIEIPDLAEDFLSFSDDFVILKPLTTDEARRPRSLGELPTLPIEKNAYRDFMLRTRETLTSLGYPTTNYDAHVPMHFTKSRVRDAYEALKEHTSEKRLGGIVNKVAILNVAQKAEGFRPQTLRQGKYRVGWWRSPPGNAEIVRQKCERGPLFLNFDDGSFGPEIRGYLDERFPTPASWELPRDTREIPAYRPLHVHVVKASEWVIGRIAEAICAERTTISRAPDPKADVNFYVHHLAMRDHVPGTFNVAWMTHFPGPNEQRKRRVFREAAEKADLCLAMCEQTAKHCPPEKTRIWAGAPDAVFVKPTIRLGVAVKPGPRKGLEKLDAIRGMPGVEIVETKGTLPLSELPAFFRSIDYLVITSDLEGGPYSVMEAIASGKPVIAPNVGFCWDWPVLRYDGTAEGLAAIVRKLRLPSDPWAAASRDLEAILREEIQKRETFDPGDGHGRLPYFYHRTNCGLASRLRRTERTVELPIADRWLSSCDPANVVELGAVTPYYWPGRIATVVDPADPKATERKSLFDVDLTGRDVLSISTIEHVGERAYGLAEDRTPLEALQKIVVEARRFLVTFPCGWHTEGAKALEAYVLGRPEGLAVRVLARGADERWGTGAPLPYGDKRKPWANAVAVIER